MPTVQSAYTRPPRYQYNGHIQTIVPSLTRQVPGVVYGRERLTLSDGDFVDLDWLCQPQHEKLVVLTHGLEGDSHRQYIKGTASLFHANGFDVLAWNCRSCSGEMNRAFRLYNHGEIGDIGEVVVHALNQKAYAEIMLVGYSMGGNITLKYAGVYGRNLPQAVKGAIAISAPVNLETSAGLLDRPSNRFYRNWFMKKLAGKMIRKAAQYPGRIELNKLKQIRWWKDFDDYFSAPVNGYRDADDFYQQASAIHFMPGLTIPTLLLNAQNDPLLSPECFPHELARQLPSLFVETPLQGGHVGFMVSRDVHTYAERRALAFAKGQYG
ncbi:alpha/beta fold hydrolase [Fibrella sp. HMF5335]|uniref:Alpha/beta fold hydrolase n=1 Tax=Fibrella rubiginis TaxID=2817060 RepID=A0A939GFV8_9BACT|nr:alpha/beta fold hydrolase [Fibrella rubiginis]MBO0937576.1 alpha/beta fold hydrolase [Fibrella rubiginis]